MEQAKEQPKQEKPKRVAIRQLGVWADKGIPKKQDSSLPEEVTPTKETKIEEKETKEKETKPDKPDRGFVMSNTSNQDDFDDFEEEFPKPKKEVKKEVKKETKKETKEKPVKAVVPEKTSPKDEIEEDQYDKNKIPSVTSFDDMGLNDMLLKGVYGYGFEKPSVIQQRAIPVMLKGRQVIAQAQSGTGKTGTFSIGALQMIDLKKRACQVLVLSPTRELATQTFNVMTQLSSFMPDIRILSCVGGTSIRESVDDLEKGVHVVVGTPGRIYDMIKRRKLDLNSLKICILDEADEMLSSGFMEQMIDIFNCIPENTQKCLFSATLSREIMEVTTKFMKDPVNILVKKEELTLEGIKQHYINIDREEFKFDTLCDLYERLTITQAIIYVNTIKKVDWLRGQLTARDFTVSFIHSEISQEERTRVMDEYRTGKSRVLISTDLLARGIDVQQVSLVINYDMPQNLANYLHRIGRSGRFGRKGVAINFVIYQDRQKLKDIESHYQTQITELPENFETL